MAPGETRSRGAVSLLYRRLRALLQPVSHFFRLSFADEIGKWNPFLGLALADIFDTFSKRLRMILR